MKSEAKFVLLIEKEATFQRLLDSQFYSKCGPSILITVNTLHTQLTKTIIVYLLLREKDTLTSIHERWSNAYGNFSRFLS